MKIKDGIKLGIGATIGYCITYGIVIGVYKALLIHYQKLIDKGVFDSEDVDVFNKTLAFCNCDERFRCKPENTTKAKIGFAVD